jgi:hypothetical protein
MGYKLLDAAQTRWRRINGHELVALVRPGATFIDGKLQERTDEHTAPTDEECAARDSRRTSSTTIDNSSLRAH